jgi:translation elongation factor EF-G
MIYRFYWRNEEDWWGIDEPQDVYLEIEAQQEVVEKLLNENRDEIEKLLDDNQTDIDDMEKKLTNFFKKKGLKVNKVIEPIEVNLDDI